MDQVNFGKSWNFLELVDDEASKANDIAVLVGRRFMFREGASCTRKHCPISLAMVLGASCQSFPRTRAADELSFYEILCSTPGKTKAQASGRKPVPHLSR